MIKIENLNYIYQQGMPFEKAALNNINLEIESGSFTAIIGHTGSGKSTLIQHFNALLKPSSGKIIINGYDITAPEADLKKVRKMVGLVFQYPEHQLFEETVYKDIAFGPKNMGFSEEKIKECVCLAAKATGISEDLFKKSPFELSGGQKRRVAIAGVLAMQPKILIFDEPMAGLDPHGRNCIIKLLKSIHKNNKNQTIIFVSHSMEDVARLADNIIVLNKGSVAMHGSVGEVFSRSAELSKMGLSVPQVTELFRELNESGINLPLDTYTVEKAAEAIAEYLKGGAPC